MHALDARRSRDGLAQLGVKVAHERVLRHAPRRRHRARGRRAGSRAPRATRHQPAPPRADGARHLARRDDDAPRRRRPPRRLRAAARRSRRSRRSPSCPRRAIPPALARTSAFLTHPVFNAHHSETEMLRYMQQARGARPLAHALDDPARLVHDEAQRDDRDDARSPGPSSDGIHPFAPRRAGAGLRAALRASSRRGSPRSPASPAVSLQPNAGAQGEYAGLLVIRRTTRRAAQGHRNVCLIPPSAHGTNPASAVMAGMQVVVVTTRRERQHRRRRSRGEGEGARGRARRADGHVPVDARRVRGGDQARSARSSTSTAARSTWTART